MSELDMLKNDLEKETVKLISEVEDLYRVFFDSIKAKKDREDGTLVGIKVKFVDEDSEPIYEPSFNNRFIATESNFNLGVRVGSERIIAAMAIDPKRLDMPASEILGTAIFNLISDFEYMHDVHFKSIKGKKSKKGMGADITVTFESD